MRKVLVLATIVIAAMAQDTDSFYSAIRANNLAQLKALLRGASNVAVADSRGITPLMYAAEVGSLDAMRLLIESTKRLRTDHTDGLKVFEKGGWAQLIPDPDEPVFHIYAEGRTREDSMRLEAKYRAMLEEIVSAQPAETLN